MHTSADPRTQSVPFFMPELAPHLGERRQGVSDLERASELLSHAVHYLVSEQLAGRRAPVAPNRDAIAILCAAGRELAAAERRRPLHRSIASWLRGAALHRATSVDSDPLGS